MITATRKMEIPVSALTRCLVGFLYDHGDDKYVMHYGTVTSVDPKTITLTDVSTGEIGTFDRPRVVSTISRVNKNQWITNYRIDGDVLVKVPQAYTLPILVGREIMFTYQGSEEIFGGLVVSDEPRQIKVSHEYNDDQLQTLFIKALIRELYVVGNNGNVRKIKM